MKKLLLLPLIPTAFAQEQAPSEWNTDLAYGCWVDKHSCINLALLHVQGTQRLLPQNDTTWLRVELSGSLALDRRSVRRADALFDRGASTGAHADHFGPHKLVLPELALMQYFAGKRACLVAGMVNLANDVDAVGIANDSFATFTHGSLVNSSVLPLPDGNAGAVLHVDFTGRDSAVLAVSRTGAVCGGDPFRSGPPGCCVVGEFAHQFDNPSATLRINPFYSHSHGGVAASVEYEASDSATLFARTGAGAGGEGGRTADFSCGAIFKPIPSRPDDFCGIAYANTKGDARENILELMYNFQVTGHFKLMPHIQYSSKDEFLFGIQAVISF